MRIFIFLLCATVFGLNPNSSFSQEKVIINQSQSVSVDEMFNIIQQQTNYHFIFPKKLFKNSPTIQLEQGEVLVISLLGKALQDSNLEFEIDENNTILIKKIDHNYDRRQQKVKVSGTIRDESGMPLPGVTVMEKGTVNGVATDFNGVYSISVSDNAILEYTFVGFVKETRDVKELTYYSGVDITLKENVNALQEVVVTGYQTLSKERATGSFETVGVEQLQQRPAATFVERIVGQVPGVSVSPWSGKIEIRGRSTVFNGYDDVLIIVDGFPLTQQDDYNSINPEDIETLTVLKDAAAASVWGAKASNGVIVITTKTGSKNKKLSVDYSSFVEFQEKVDLGDMRLMSVAEEIDIEEEFLEKNWVDLNSLANGTSSINDFYLANIYRNGLAPDGNTWSQDTYDNYINELSSREDVTKQFEKYLLRNAFRETHNISLQGGGEKNTFYASLGYTNYKSHLIGDKDDRLSFNLRNTFDFTDKIKFTTGVTAVQRNEKNNGISVDAADQLQAYDQLIDENGQYVQKYVNWTPWLSREREAIVGSPHTFNLVEEQRNQDNSQQFLDVRADFRVDVELFNGLTVSPSFRYERGAGDIDNFRNMNLPSHRNFINDYFVNGNYQIPVGSDYEQRKEHYKGWTMRNTFNYDNSFGKHDITLFGGIEYNRRFSENSLNRHFGYNKQATLYIAYDELGLFNRSLRDFQGVPDYNLYQGIFQDVNNVDNRFVSWFGNLGYTFNDKYILNASYRVDQANIFGSDPDFRYKPLWSVGLGWNMVKEDFLASTDWLNRLTLRGTYGLSGNSLGAASPYASAFSRTNTYKYSYFFSRFSIPANPNLKWEETVTTNAAIDFALFNNRLSGTFEYYKKASSDVYSRRPLDPTVGFTDATVNYAEIDNEGLELQLNARVIDKEDFSWDIRANFNKNKNVVREFQGSTQTADYLSAGVGILAGAAVNNYYAYNYAGLDENGELLIYDQNGDSQHWSTEFVKEDLVYLGSKTPQHYGGLSTTFRYKGFDLTANLNYGADFYFRYRPNYASSGYGTYNSILNTAQRNFGNLRLDKMWADRWREPGDEATTGVPRLFWNGVNPYTGLVESRFTGSSQDRKFSQSTFNTVKGDYIRVQDIILGYNCPSSLTDRTFFNSLRFTFQVTNPFLWVENDFGVDPTVYDRESRATSNLTRFTLGLRANF
ncbi:SusC/RagA family TonB-linked outer membrane protein [Aestuariibaculum sediminum]|uniref:SusC/RagA family TonB-linked outer membrane protein n=1 Tax=Aestuariibaculum sediminum TaxID=2770637 RepID=A0A8J6Q2R9_9FLAO|nr:SusC/RagA family TonB-linked outer membrane protein [Aestuariibaculum sediminum]MBD0832571.1 SusC/RagA family TonB-linked outer membrane protein [Aestuariibaculum sediminum]